MKPKIYLDMDGVLIDFVGGALKVHNLTDRNIFIKDYFGGMGREKFWSAINKAGVDFWANLEKTPEADELVKVLEFDYGRENILIVTAPTESVVEACVAGKKISMKKHFPHLANQMVFIDNKSLIAHGNAILIDDNETQTDAFVREGGNAVLVPRPWNSAHTSEDENLVRYVGAWARFRIGPNGIKAGNVL